MYQLIQFLDHCLDSLLSHFFFEHFLEDSQYYFELISLLLRYFHADTKYRTFWWLSDKLYDLFEFLVLIFSLLVYLHYFGKYLLIAIEI